MLPCFEWSFDRCFLVQNSMPRKRKCPPAHFINNKSFQRAQGKIDTSYPHCYSLDSTVVLRHARKSNSNLILIITGWARNLLDLEHSISLPIFDLQENVSIQNSFSRSRLPSIMCVKQSKRNSRVLKTDLHPQTYCTSFVYGQLCHDK